MSSKKRFIISYPSSLKQQLKFIERKHHSLVRRTIKNNWSLNPMLKPEPVNHFKNPCSLVESGKFGLALITVFVFSMMWIEIAWLFTFWQLV